MNASKHILLFCCGLLIFASVRAGSAYRTPSKDHERTLKAKKEKLGVDMKKSQQVDFGAEQRKRKKWGKKKEKARVFSEMTFDELKVAREKQKQARNTDAVLKYTERMVRLCDDLEEAASLLVEYADLLYADGKIKKAGALYTQFVELYPGNAHVEYALYQAMLCSFYHMLSYDRDQSITHDTIALADKFLKHTTFTKYRKQVVDLRLQCYDRILQSELNVCDFYLKNNRPKPVNKRLAQVRSEWLPKIPEREATILAYEIRLAQLEGDVQKVAEKEALLKKVDPFSLVLEKKPFSFRDLL